MKRIYEPVFGYVISVGTYAAVKADVQILSKRIQLIYEDFTV